MFPRRPTLARFAVLAVLSLPLAAPGAGAADAPPGREVAGERLAIPRGVVVNFAELARREALRPRPDGLQVRPRVFHRGLQEPPEPEAAFAPAPVSPLAPQQALAPSPAPSSSFAGLDDIPMVDSLYIVIPPDVGGAVGPTRVMESFNNNYRIHDKATGLTLLTLGTATFWNDALTDKSLLGLLTDPHTVYDPIQNRWIACMQTVNGAGHVLIGVSETSDPAGNWFLYDVPTGALLDYPILGYNKNWIVVTINRYSAGGTFQRGITIVANYPQARAGTLTGATIFTQAANSHFCTAPCATLSATQDSLFLVTHLSSSGATFAVDVVTGSATPVYTAGGTRTRAGGGWAQPSGQILPQSAPVAGASSCGATPCKIECQDSQVRSEPVYRVDAASGQGRIYYAQTIGLPASGLTHTAVQWSAITPGLLAELAEGGRIEDPTATATNGGKWYAYSHIAANGQGDYLVGFSEFSSVTHPSAGYAYHDHADGAGTLRDPFVYKAGADYYHKDFGGGRNRWGDFTKAQVDPVDDRTLWALQEYAKARVSTDDGTTGSNGSRWASWWAAVTPAGATQYTIDASAGPNGSITPSGAVLVTAGADQAFTIAADANHHVADVLVDGSSIGAVTGHTFTNVQANHTIAASFAPDSFTLSVSVAGSGTVARTPDQPLYAYGSGVSLLATPGSGWGFSGWSGDVTSADNPLGLTVLGALSLTATFADTAAPQAQVLAPAPHAVLAVGANATLAWSASDNVGVTAVDLQLSRSGAGGPFDPLATGIANTGTFDWAVTGPTSTAAFLRVRAHDAAGHVGVATSDTAFSIVDATAVEGGTPLDFALSRVTPNPVRGAARVTFGLPRAAAIRVSVLDVQGRELAVLADGERAAGVHEVTWADASAAPGLYLVRLRAPGRTLVRRFVRLR